MMRRRIVACGVAAGMLGMLAFWLWPRPRVNVLLITLDTTRADRLGCYGYATARTPVLDALAASGVLCEHAYTVAPLTLPAHTSLFTGLYPRETGVRSNGRGRLDDSIPTLAEVFKRHGYDTAAFVASFVLDAKFGLNRGFHRYNDEIGGESADGDSLHRERDGGLVVDAALEWLEGKRSQPFFCWIHLYDPHAPYLAHADLFGDTFADHPYDGEIAYVDRQVGRLINFLKNRGLESQTLVVVVGDHGEGLREHLERSHGMTLYNDTLHVPLILRQPGRLAAGRRVPGNVSMVDLSPTILGLVGFPDARQVTGKDVAARLLGSESPASVCYGATDEPLLNNGWSPLRSLTEVSWKYIRTTRPELYDLANDPGERHDLAATNPEKTREMETRLAELESRLVLRDGATVQLRPDERRALESLGYLGGGKSTPSQQAPPVLPDIKDMLPTEIAVENAVDWIGEGELDAAIEQLRDVILQSPGHAKGHWFLALALRQKSRFDDATELLNSLLKTRPEWAEGHYGLGLVSLEQGRVADAIVEFQKSLDLNPDFADPHYDLAMIHLSRDEPDEALRQFNAVLEIDRFHSAAYRERGSLRVRQGRVAEAIGDYRTALKYAPEDSLVHHNLAVVLGAGDESVKHLKRAVELTPENAEYQYSLGSLLLLRRNYQEAFQHLAKAVKLQPTHAGAQERLQEARAALKQ